jgi:hypothetical protein
VVRFETTSTDPIESGAWLRSRRFAATSKMNAFFFVRAEALGRRLTVATMDADSGERIALVLEEDGRVRALDGEPLALRMAAVEPRLSIGLAAERGPRVAVSFDSVTFESGTP